MCGSQKPFSIFFLVQLDVYTFSFTLSFYSFERRHLAKPFKSHYSFVFWLISKSLNIHDFLWVDQFFSGNGQELYMCRRRRRLWKTQGNKCPFSWVLNTAKVFLVILWVSRLNANLCFEWKFRDFHLSNLWTVNFPPRTANA